MAQHFGTSGNKLRLYNDTSRIIMNSCPIGDRTLTVKFTFTHTSYWRARTIRMVRHISFRNIIQLFYLKNTIHHRFLHIVVTIPDSLLFTLNFLLSFFIISFYIIPQKSDISFNICVQAWHIRSYSMNKFKYG